MDEGGGSSSQDERCNVLWMVSGGEEAEQSVKSVVYKYTYILMMVKKEKWAYILVQRNRQLDGWMDGWLVG